MPQKNQHKPCRQYLIFLTWVYHINPCFLAPEEDIRKAFKEYFELGCSDVSITELLKLHYDTETYGLR
jgi:hypothetical protein